MPNLIGKTAGGAVRRLCSGGEHTRTLKEQLSPVVHCGGIRLLRHVTAATLSCKSPAEVVAGCINDRPTEGPTENEE